MYLPMTKNQLRTGQSRRLRPQFSRKVETLQNRQGGQNSELSTEAISAFRRYDATLPLAEYGVQFSCNGKKKCLSLVSRKEWTINSIFASNIEDIVSIFFYSIPRVYGIFSPNNDKYLRAENLSHYRCYNKIFRLAPSQECGTQGITNNCTRVSIEMYRNVQ